MTTHDELNTFISVVDWQYHLIDPPVNRKKFLCSEIFAIETGHYDLLTFIEP